MTRSISTFIVAALAATTFFAISPVSADILFEEDFDGYTHFPDAFPGGDPVNFGVALNSEGAINDWYGARFEQPDGAIDPNPITDIHLDLAVQRIPGGGRPDPDPVGRAGDDAGMLFKISTLGYENVQLTYDYRTFLADSGDKAVVAFTTADLDPFFPGGAGTIADIFGDPNGGNGQMVGDSNPYYEATFTELMRAGASNSWKTKTKTLPSDEPEVWVAFWIDNGDSDFMKFDNITVTADLIPEPTSFMLLGLGGLILTRRR